MDAAQFLPTEPSPEVTQIHEGDYKDTDGLWHCGVRKLPGIPPV